MKNKHFAKSLLFLSFIILFANSAIAVRVKDLAGIRGMRENQLIGYGIIVGLNGTGDSHDSLPGHGREYLNRLYHILAVVRGISGISIDRDRTPP